MSHSLTSLVDPVVGL